MLNHLKTAWRHLFSIPGFILLTAAWVAVNPLLLRTADTALFRMSALLQPSHEQSRHLVLAALPKLTPGQSRGVSHEIGRLRIDLNRLDAAHPSSVGIVVNGNLAAALRWSEQGQALLRESVRGGRLLGLPEASVQDEQIPRVSKIVTEWPTDALPVAQSSAGAARPLIWRDGHSIVPGLGAAMFGRLQSVQLAWISAGGLRFGKKLLTTGPDGFIRSVPYLDTAPHQSTGMTVVPLDTLISRRSLAKLHGKAVLIGSPSDPAFRSAADTLIGLLRGNSAHTPGWGLWLGRVLPLAVAAYLVVLIPRLSFTLGLVLTSFIGFAGVTATLGLYLTDSLWLPLGGALAVLLGGYLLLVMARPDQQYRAVLADRADEASRLLGAYQLEQGDYEPAFAALRKCRPTGYVLDLLYRLGLEFERRRQFDRARAAFNYIESRRRGYKDVAQHVRSLDKVSETTGATALAPSATRTLILPELALQRPVLGRYEIEREIGRGSHGVVYLGRDPRIGRSVAIKTMDFSQFPADELDAVKERFSREAETAGRLDHPSIVTVYDAGDDQNLAYIAMDFVPGQTLSSFSEPGYLLNVPVVYRLIAEAAEALDYAHRQHVVHRDVKPGNILYNPDDGQLKITDFGIARIADSNRTRTGTLMGSPFYMAPEQLAGKPVDGRTDVFSLGVTFYQLLTGQRPFAGETLAALAYQITNVKHLDVRALRPDLPASASRIVNKALQKAPDRRFRTALDMAEAVRKGLGRLGAERSTGS